MLRELWWERDAIAQEQDLGPEKVLPGKALGALADSHPTSLESLKRSSALRTRTRRALAERFWAAIERGRNTDDLPSKTPPAKDGLPDVRNWKHRHPEENARWELIRPLILNRADTLGIRQDVLLKPLIQRTLAWEGWKSLDDIDRKSTRLNSSHRIQSRMPSSA